LLFLQDLKQKLQLCADSCIPITSLLPCAGQLKITFFCDAILCYLVDRYHQFGQSYCLHFLGGVGWCWQHVLHTHWYLSSKLVGITSQNTVVFVSHCCEIVKSDQIYRSWKVLATHKFILACKNADIKGNCVHEFKEKCWWHFDQLLSYIWKVIKSMQGA